MAFLQAALNGARRHPGAPRTPDRIAADSATAVRLGVHSVHVHAFDEAGEETLDRDACAAVLQAIRGVAPAVPISLTTSASIEPDPERRLALVHGWSVLPDLVSANQGEDGITTLCEHLMGRGVGIEAGLLSVEDARRFSQWPVRHACRRVLLEPLAADPAEAVREAAAMAGIVEASGVTLDQVHHGVDIASWAVNRQALARGQGIRTGFEDTAVLPDGTAATSNEQLIRAALALIGAG